ncbi:MAG: CDP-alcohol phosphatidyltransferase family protein, partial [Chloroflexi bacterium]|nr:CDP-alcohol phosphatidyltransferase family protein [Chloroflexota bacterium]
MATHGIVPDRAASATRGGLRPIAQRLHGMGVSANAITALGVLLTLAGAVLVALDRPLAALAVLLAGSVADTLDGAIARVSGGGTPFGAFFDSTADRVADAALLGATVWLGASTGDDALLIAALVAMPLAFLVPYVRAKAESLGVAATVGPAPREARLLILLVGLAAWGLSGLSVAFT